LDLPVESKIHHVFHVSQLKKKLGVNVQTQHQAPTEMVEQISEPELIMHRRMVNKKNKATGEVLVKWNFLPAEEASWENYWDLIRIFRTFDIEARLFSGGKH